MIKNYKLFILNENISLSNEDVIDIIKSLETEDNKNSALINRLVNYADKNGKTVLMSMVQHNKEDLVDYVLSFKPNINSVTKNNENVLFFCKNINMFNKFYDLGADIDLKNNKGQNILICLANKKIFSEEVYQKLINSGIDINELDEYSTNALPPLIENLKAIKFFVKNNIDLNINDKFQKSIFRILVYRYRHYEKSRKKIMDILIYLFDNGLKIIDSSRFIDSTLDEIRYFENNSELLLDFIIKLANYLDEDLLFSAITKYFYYGYDAALRILNSGIHPKLFKKLRHFYGHSKTNVFDEYVKKHPYIEDMDKYNI